LLPAHSWQQAPEFCPACLAHNNQIYLPALVSIQKDLNTDATATAGSVAIYLFL
jgi:hypothetical protein